MFALALMVMRALVSHPLSGLALDLGRYRVPRVSVYPVFHHVVFLAASGELSNIFGRANCSIYKEAYFCCQPILLPPRQECPQNARMLGRQRDGSDIVPAPLPHLLHPATLLVSAFGTEL